MNGPQVHMPIRASLIYCYSRAGGSGNILMIPPLWSEPVIQRCNQGNWRSCQPLSYSHVQLTTLHKQNFVEITVAALYQINGLACISLPASFGITQDFA